MWVWFVYNANSNEYTVTRKESMNIPDSMKDDLGAWNNGKGVDLESWIACAGNFSLAVGYSSIFCPDFIEFEGYIFEGDEFCEREIENLRDFESQEDSTPKSIEIVMNHLHIADIHFDGCEDLSADKIIIIGETLKDIYEARLAYLFPNKPCIVEFFKPEDENELQDYQLYFWQKKHD